MKNVKAVLDGDTLTITVDLSQQVGTSRKQGNKMIATTEGNIRIRGNQFLMVNVFEQQEQTAIEKTIEEMSKEEKEEERGRKTA